MKDAAPETLRPGWKSVVLVCKACEKRSKGPKKLSAKELAKALGRACRDAKVPRSRVVLTTCMGACPKKAFTVAAAAPSGHITMIAFQRGDDAGAAVATLFLAASSEPYSNSTSSTPSPT
jgi:predicted metal-binding protein